MGTILEDILGGRFGGHVDAISEKCSSTSEGIFEDSFEHNTLQSSDWKSSRYHFGDDCGGLFGDIFRGHFETISETLLELII